MRALEHCLEAKELERKFYLLAVGNLLNIYLRHANRGLRVLQRRHVCLCKPAGSPARLKFPFQARQLKPPVGSY